MSTGNITPQQLVDAYIQLRDRRSQRKKAFELDDEADKRHQEKIERLLLEKFTAEGIDSIKCDAGTAYTSTRTSVTAADQEVYMNFVRTGELWHLLEVRPAKKAVEEYLEVNHELPPGLNMSREVVVNVRRS